MANKLMLNLTPHQTNNTKTSILQLSNNENPLGPSPKALLAANNHLHLSHRYPDNSYTELKQAIAKSLNMHPEQVTLGNGSENILELLVTAYLSTADNAILSEYAFLTIPLILQSHGINTKLIPARDWKHDIATMINAVNDKTRILFLVNPNNPTGTYTNKKDFQTLINAVPAHVLIVVDEAYCEYITKQDYPNTLHYLEQYPNLVSVRTFSKIHGLAGLRLGYAISSHSIAEKLNQARLPFNVNAIAAKAGCAALTDLDHIKKSLALNQQGLNQLEVGLKQLNLSFIPSIANFISIDVGDADLIYQKLLQEGVIVKSLKTYNMPKHIRVSVGTPEQNERFLTTLKYCQIPQKSA